MATHEALNYTTKKHQGTVEEAHKRGMPTKIAAPQAESGPRSANSGVKSARKGMSVPRVQQ